MAGERAGEWFLAGGTRPSGFVTRGRAEQQADRVLTDDRFASPELTIKNTAEEDRRPLRIRASLQSDAEPRGPKCLVNMEPVNYRLSGLLLSKFGNTAGDLSASREAHLCLPLPPGKNTSSL